MSMDNIKSLCVLIVDDSSVMRKIVERSVRQTGLAVEKIIEAENGAAALTILNSQQPDLILSDINMPTMDGLELLRQIQAAGDTMKVPIVMITTEGSEAKVQEAISLGARGFIRKPFTPQEVKEQIARALEIW
jgi:two-component system, chemotaxis family, chemotaxis protein CheY